MGNSPSSTSRRQRPVTTMSSSLSPEYDPIYEKHSLSRKGSARSMNSFSTASTPPPPYHEVVPAKRSSARANSQAPTHSRSSSSYIDIQRLERRLITSSHSSSGMEDADMRFALELCRARPIAASDCDYSVTNLTVPKIQVVAPRSRSPPRRQENALHMLHNYDTVIVVDDSYSMDKSRWSQTREALASLADVAAEHGLAGFDVHFLNSSKTRQGLKSSRAVRELFDTVRPSGITPTGTKLEKLLRRYLKTLEDAQKAENEGKTDALSNIKPINYIVITDGAPTDDPEQVIVQAARRLDRGDFPVTQVGIQFVQVGNDRRATQALEELDDNLTRIHGIRDMVDTTPIGHGNGVLDAEVLTKILLGGINRRVDKKGARCVME